ncbi:response regulator [Myxococcota bacterium]|nr:response regulator [Myxococcota bacterium]
MPSILIIDDNAPFRAALERILVRHGYEIVSAEDGSVGLARFQERAFDLVMTDLFMPEKEGFETIVEMLRLRPDARIIAMSGGFRGLGMQMLPAALRFGAKAMLQKPIETETLLTTIREVLAT